jgi:hypothetical protein
MVIFPNALILSAEDAGIPLTHPRIGWHTHTRDDDVIVTVSTETDAGPKENPLEPSTHGYWQASAMPATWEIDLGATRSIDYLGIAEHTIGTLGVAVKAETSMGDTVGSPPVQVWEELGGEVSPGDDSPIMFLDDARNARYVRITLTGDSPPKIGVIYTGLILAMQRPPEMGLEPITLSRKTEMHTSMSVGGQILGQAIKNYGVEASISFTRLDHDWYRTVFDEFVKSARSKPYFFSWRPEDYPEEVAYVVTTEDIRPSYSEWIYFAVSWTMRGIGNE